MHEATAQLIDQLEREARARSEQLEAQGKLSGTRFGLTFTQRHYPLTAREQVELAVLKGAGRAATDADTYVALCRGERVPAHRLDQRIVARVLERMSRGD